MNLRRHSLIKVALLAAVAALMPNRPAMAESAIKPTLETLFEPLLADPTYPHIAVSGKLDRKEVQLDIGAPVDLYQNRTRDFAVGVDFGTWSLLRRNDDFKFPVDAIDYLFGVNATWKRKFDDSVLPFDTMTTKLRVSHISAHFEDGHYDEATRAWLNPEEAPTPGKIPFTYSREFVNLTTALSAPGGKVYLGYQYMFHTIPGDINPHSFQAGAEVGLPAHSYVAADVKLLPAWSTEKQKTDSFRGTWNLQAGMRLTSIGLDQVRVACNYFTGISRQGMYLNKTENYTSLGMIIDL
ncbi:MAG: DUF1207 domain-containing protein [Chlorobiaceae bacterium]|nr:DUF1207 domain-containing protein [Chlorobiaceae bacterium]